MNATDAVDMVSQISSSDNLLDETAFTFADDQTAISISTEDSETYQVSLSDTQGRRFMETTLNGQVSLQKAGLASGLYLVTIRGQKGLLSRQIFVD